MVYETGNISFGRRKYGQMKPEPVFGVLNGFLWSRCTSKVFEGPSPPVPKSSLDLLSSLNFSSDPWELLDLWMCCLLHPAGDWTDLCRLLHYSTFSAKVSICSACSPVILERIGLEQRSGPVCSLLRSLPWALIEDGQWVTCLVVARGR